MKALFSFAIVVAGLFVASCGGKGSSGHAAEEVVVPEGFTTYEFANFSISVPEESLDLLFKFIEIVWKSFKSGDSSIFLSSRRIQSIIKGWTLCGRFTDAIQMALAHYPEDEAKALVNVWQAVCPEEKSAPEDD